VVWPWLSSFESPAHPVKSLTSNCPAPGAHSSQIEIPQRSSLLRWCHVLFFWAAQVTAKAPTSIRNDLGLSPGLPGPLGHAASSLIVASVLGAPPCEER